jgi:1-acyl-sn-glycerol-3-phosphate acyltransferase
VRINARGLPTSATALLVANHISWLDIFCVASVCPTHFLAKREVAGWPLIGWLTRRVGTAFIRRGGENGAQDAAEQLIWRLRQGEHLLIFPEGTSTDGKTVKRFYPRLFQAAIHAECPVQAIALRYPHGDGVHPRVPFIGNDDFLSHLWVLLGETGIVAELRFLEPLRSNSRDFLATETHRRILRTLNARTTQRKLKLGSLV